MRGCRRPPSGHSGLATPPGRSLSLASRKEPARPARKGYRLSQGVNIRPRRGDVPVAVARRLAAFGGGAAPEGNSVADAVRPLVAAHRRVFPGADAALLQRAYSV